MQFSFIRVVLETIYFYNKARFMTIKIRNKIVNNTLLIYSNRIMPQKVIPQMLFLTCHITA